MFHYQLLDMQYLAMMPLSFVAQALNEALSSPLAPCYHTPWGRSLAAMVSRIERNTRLRRKPDFSITKTKFRNTSIDVSDHIVMSHPFCQLRAFERTTPDPDIMEHIKNDPKVLIVTPLSGHFATLMRGTVEAMLPSHNVFITDWVDAKMVPLSDGYFDLDDQIDLLIEIIKKCGPDLHIIAISQASVSAFCATALMAAQEYSASPLSLTLIGGPIDPQGDGAALAETAQSHTLSWFRETKIQYVPLYYPGAMRPVFSGMKQLLDRMSMTMDRHITEQVKYYQHLLRGDDDSTEEHEKFYDEFLSVMDVTQEFYLQYIERTYQNRALANGCFMSRGRKVDPSLITKTAVLTIEGELDDLSPPGHTRAALDLCPNLSAKMKHAHLEINVGHYGVFNGRKWRNNVQPIIHKFIREHALRSEGTGSLGESE